MQTTFLQLALIADAIVFKSRLETRSKSYGRGTGERRKDMNANETSEVSPPSTWGMERGNIIQIRAVVLRPRGRRPSCAQCGVCRVRKRGVGAEAEGADSEIRSNAYAVNGWIW